MFTHKSCKNIAKLIICCVMLITALYSKAQTPRLGKALGPAALSNFDLIAAPDGSGLPVGDGTASQGKLVYETQCQVCHGAGGEGNGSANRLVGGDMQSDDAPIRTVGSFWPHATTLFDYVRRAMPATAPKSLSNTEVYQVIAYVLHMNGLVGLNEVVDRRSLLQIKMPNREGFIDSSNIR
ncbi:MAG: cytochrome c [Gammaproteobacteria bacterium]|jgi:cytochrome c|nr:cytochrome c [Gammaproteobacteria bacterium]MDB2445055.1 cytochrome c [Gammaproteobacteria bacterium]MDG0998541.1 cytochrome c [Gammaproteobacteria bacterium]MDG1952613.1 cytochrome c [Gammaproteobacteria bacterium]|tara:strand:+ start:5509 stop:6051 length:543 start_codon:yes stop_codon:yes gene_type:complete